MKEEDVRIFLKAYRELVVKHGMKIMFDADGWCVSDGECRLVFKTDIFHLDLDLKEGK